MASQTPLINGTAFAWAQVQFNILGVNVVGVRAFNYAVSQTKTNQMASGTEPSSRVYGPKEYTASIELEMKEVERIRDAMNSQSKSLLDIPPFTITVAFLENYKNVVHKVLNCEFTEDGNDLKQGEPVNRAFALIIAGIEFN